MTDAVQRITLDDRNTGPAPLADRLIVNGRYKIPHPTTGADTTWQRASNFAKVLDNETGLTKWKLRMAAMGVVRRDDLHIAAAAAAGELAAAEAEVEAKGGPDSTRAAKAVAAVKKAKKDLDEVIDAAIDAAGGTAGATTGTALHSFLERINRGEPKVDAPAAWRGDLAAYRAEVERLGLAPLRHEVLVVNTRLKVAGRFDLLGQIRHLPLPLIMDYKTGKVKGKQIAHALQMVCYATADWIVTFDPIDGFTFEPMPELDLTQALIIHLPQGEGICDTYRIDLVRGMELARLAYQVRDNLSGNRTLQVPFGLPEAPPGPAVCDSCKVDPCYCDIVVDPADTLATCGRQVAGYTVPVPCDLAPGHPGGCHPGEPVAEPPDLTPDPIPEDRTTWIRQRLTRIMHDPDARRMTSEHWPRDITPTPPDGGWRDEEIDALDTLLSAVEKATRATFPPDDPGDPPIPHPSAHIDARPPGSEVAPDWPLPDDGDPVDPGDIIVLRDALGDLEAAQQLTVARWAKDAQRHGAMFHDGKTARTLAISNAVVQCVIHLWDESDTEDEMEELVRAALVYALDLPESLTPTWRTGAVMGRLSWQQALYLSKIAADFAAGDDDTVDALSDRVMAATPAAPPTDT